jgi:hypothetical protein
MGNFFFLPSLIMRMREDRWTSLAISVEGWYHIFSAAVEGPGVSLALIARCDDQRQCSTQLQRNVKITSYTFHHNCTKSSFSPPYAPSDPSVPPCSSFGATDIALRDDSAQQVCWTAPEEEPSERAHDDDENCTPNPKPKIEW